ncbi:MAG: COX15/CtaA family protein [Vicinamibacteraceae bacterium]|nr:COX15/CtaA family protein [Vicinamibacteraceae bacterium]
MFRLARFAWFTLAYNIAVILWGAYVRATGSGAGCGSHWPLCNGEVIPRAPSVETMVEFSHRATSGLALIAVVVLLVWTFRATVAGHPARRGAAWTMFFMLTEAAVGAGLVLFQLVADNASMARAMFMAVHLVNTFLLVGALTLTAHWLSGGAPVRLGSRPALAAGLVTGALGLLLVGTSGAVAALGDTLFPIGSLRAGIEADLSATSHFLIRLRVLHPVLAVAITALLVGWLARVPTAEGSREREMVRWLIGVAVLQLAAGAANVLLLAPVWMQMVHLLLADVLWILYVLIAARMLAAAEPARVRAAAPRAATV